MSPIRLYIRQFYSVLFIRYFLILYSAERACAVSDSPRAKTDAVLPKVEAPCSVNIITEERFWKS